MVSVVPQTKTGEDLLEEAVSMEAYDDIDPGYNTVRAQDTPFNQAFSALTQTGGNILQMMTRTTPEMATAMSRTYLRSCKYHSDYLVGGGNLLMRIAVSIEGQGRKEMIEAVKAGAGVPGEFYDGGEGGIGAAEPTFEKIPQAEIGDDEPDYL